jgi:hypothetical protein
MMEPIVEATTPTQKSPTAALFCWSHMALAGGSGVELGELEQWAVVTVFRRFKFQNFKSRS